MKARYVAIAVGTLAAGGAVALALGRGGVVEAPAKAAEPPSGPGETRLAAPPPFLKVAPVTESTEAGVAAATGRVTFNEDRVSRVGSPLNGRILELLVKPGDKVKKGQPLVVIASPDAQGAITDLIAAEADISVARKNLERNKRLYADQAVPQKDVLQAEGDFTKAAAAVDRARGKLEVLGIDPKQKTARFTLRAPIDGTCVERPATAGMEVRADAGAPLLTIADLASLWVLADVYERDLGQVATGQSATVRVPAYPTEAFTGKVSHVGDLVDPQTRTVKLRVVVDNKDGRLKPEMFAKVMLSAARVDGAPKILSVPAEAVLSDGEASAVIVARESGRFQKRTIEVGAEQDGKVRILAGLSPGENVVVEGALFIKAEIDDR
jgi:cobalt-zinc-cadmium efflux system membrane fusion protein